jgi:hypothetical protein
MTSTLIQCAVSKVDKNVQTHQVVFKRIGNYATNVHYRHVRIPVNMSKIIDTTTQTSPSNFSTIIKCPCTFQLVTIRSSAAITVPPGCQVDLKSHIITLDSATTDSDLETIHYEWSWDSNTSFQNIIQMNSKPHSYISGTLPLFQ